METNAYLLAALVSSGIFLLQFFLSIFLGSLDADLDVNADGHADWDLGSILSFKGLIHFCMGFGWFMFLCPTPYVLLHYVGALVSGVFFVFILTWIYKLCYRLRQENKPEQGQELVGRSCEIYAHSGELQQSIGADYVVRTTINGAQRELTVRSASGKNYAEGERATLIGYKNGIYYME